MAKTPPDIIATPAAPGLAIPRPRLHSLTVRNFRAIGNSPVTVELDDIVVLVGPNNAGKSSILRAYEVVMFHGSKDGELTIDDFPNGAISTGSLPTIELETVVFDKTAPGEKWVRTDAENEMFVRERWTWTSPGTPKKVGWDVSAGDWHSSEGPWGAPNVAQAYRPKPHRVSAFRNPSEQADQVVKLLQEALKSRVIEASKKKAGEAGSYEPSEYEQLLDAVKSLQKTIAADATEAVDDVRKELGNTIAEIFPGYSVTFDARPEDDIEKSISLFKAAPVLKMGLDGGFQVSLDRQGSGACRTLLWAALRILADKPSGKSAASNERPNILLIDEPELCLHPDAIREACRVLYDLPKTKSWQVMITTHSPVFIDLSRDNTSIARVERLGSGIVKGTTIFRPAKAKLDDNDKTELKLLNQCDPYVSEFFFGGKTILVEGDTEYTAFKHVVAKDPKAYSNVHVVRARGKSCLISLCKILNQFDKGYAVLHDSDRETVISKKTKKERKNAAWTVNQNILDITREGRDAGNIRLLASVPNFEEAFFGEEVSLDKPFSALAHLKSDESTFLTIKSLLDALINSSKPIPGGAVAWTAIGELATRVADFDAPLHETHTAKI